MQEFIPRGLCAAAIVALAMQATAAESLCVSLGPRRAELPRIAREAVALLSACGHDPADYELELSQDDRFAGEGSGWTVEFHPRRSASHYPLGIRMDQPCLLQWLDGGEAHPRQREVMRLVRGIAAERGLEGWKQLTVSESAEWVGVELRFDVDGDRAPLWRILLDRRDLSLLEVSAP